MKNLNQLNLTELNHRDMYDDRGGHWAINLAAATFGIFYTLGKDSYYLHPESFI